MQSERHLTRNAERQQRCPQGLLKVLTTVRHPETPEFESTVRRCRKVLVLALLQSSQTGNLTTVDLLSHKFSRDLSESALWAFMHDDLHTVNCAIHKALATASGNCTVKYRFKFTKTWRGYNCHARCNSQIFALAAHAAPEHPTLFPQRKLES